VTVTIVTAVIIIGGLRIPVVVLALALSFAPAALALLGLAALLLLLERVHPRRTADRGYSG
jgi:hypothetical protein